jgi:hypothetical protein
MRSFPFPLTEDALGEFLHPREDHAFAYPYRMAGEIVAGNGYLCIRCRKGRWMDEDFAEAPRDFKRRVEGLPWARFEATVELPEWRALDDVRGMLQAAPQISPWLGEKCAPSPVWRIGGQFMCRLSHLLLIARLPRCEVFLGAQDAHAGLLFRFSGGRGIVAHDKRLTIASRDLFAPQVDRIDGHVTRAVLRPKPSFRLPGWPPPDLSDG